MPAKIKNHRMDANVVSSQSWELSYIAKKFGVSVDKVKSAKKTMGKSRRRVYHFLRIATAGKGKPE